MLHDPLEVEISTPPIVHCHKDQNGTVIIVTDGITRGAFVRERSGAAGI